MRIFVRVLAALSMVAAVPAFAASQDFVRCDGFGPPGERGFDGMNLINWTNGRDLNGKSTGRNLLSMNGVAADQILPPPGRAGEFLCGVVLADPLLTDQYWVRRTYILQMMAVHQIAGGHAEAALTTLDKADAIGAAHADPWFRDSLRIANTAVRAAALQRLGRSGEARAAAEELRSARPYAPSVAMLARRLLQLIDPDVLADKARATADIPLAPSLLEEMFWRAFYDHDYARAVALSREIAFVSLAARKGWVIENSDSYNTNLADRMRAIGNTTEAAQRWIDGGGATAVHAAPGAPAAAIEKLDLAELMRLLPRPETAALAPGFVPEGKREGALNGYAIVPPNENGLIGVSFGSVRASPAMVEEAALLAAALEARRRGMDSLLIEAWETRRRNTSGSANLYFGGGPYYFGPATGIQLGEQTWSTGCEARLAVRFVSSKTLQSELEGSRWRLVQVDRVIAALQPRYPEPVSAR